MPGVICQTMRQITAPRLWWARTLEMLVKMMVAREVPRARCRMYCSGSPWAAKAKISAGTMTSPPPTPRSPARTPARAPTPA
jgi:hypothetical protein